MSIVYPNLVVLAMNSNGDPEFYMVSPECTPQQVADGEHYELAKENAGFNGYAEPMIAFDATDAAALQLLNGNVSTWLNLKKPPAGRKVRVTLGVDVAAHASCDVVIPEGENIPEYLKALGRKMGGGGVTFTPAWATNEGLRVLLVEDAATREQLAGNIQIEPSEAQRVAERYEARLQATRDVINRYWEALEHALPDFILNEFNALLKA